ncbi:MAG: bifunctional nuclease family protein [Candidatus Latescibacterota bacterium]
MIEVYVSGLAFDTISNSPVVLLKERDGKRLLPIWIGPNEAGIIALELSGMSYKRPLTHDLLKSILKGFSAHLQKVVVSALKENTFYAKFYLLASENEIIEIDARPSDSITMALKMKSPIYISEELEDSFVELSPADEENPEDDDFDEGTDEEENEEDYLSKMDLRKRLRNIKPEDFGNYNL